MCGGKTGKAHNKLISFQKPRGRPFIIISIRMSGLYNYYMSTHSVRSHYTDCHVQSRTTLYICRFPASCMHTIGATFIWEREPQATPTTTHYTITILHDKRAPHATATLPPPPRLKQEETDGRAQAPNITSPAGRLQEKFV